MVTGAFIFGDNFSLSGLKDGAKPGYAEESRKRAKAIMGNADINEYVRNNTGSFMPLYGHLPSEEQQAESFFVKDTKDYFYLAVFNYSGSVVKQGTVNFEKMGIVAENISAVKELWTGKSIAFDESGVSYDVPKKDARVYRMTKSVNIGIAGVQGDASALYLKSIGDNVVNVSAEVAIESVAVYNAAGVLLSRILSVDATSVDINLPANNGVYIIKAVLAGGEVVVRKFGR